MRPCGRRSRSPRSRRWEAPADPRAGSARRDAAGCGARGPSGRHRQRRDQEDERHRKARRPGARGRSSAPREPAGADQVRADAPRRWCCPTRRSRARRRDARPGRGRRRRSGSGSSPRCRIRPARRRPAAAAASATVTATMASAPPATATESPSTIPARRPRRAITDERSDAASAVPGDRDRAGPAARAGRAGHLRRRERGHGEGGDVGDAGQRRGREVGAERSRAVALDVGSGRREHRADDTGARASGWGIILDVSWRSPRSRPSD